MGKMTKEQIRERHYQVWDKIDEMNQALATRENGKFTAEEAEKYDALLRESNELSARAEALASGKALDAIREQKSKNEKFREILKNCQKKREDFSEVLMTREAANSTTVLKDAATGNTTGNLEAGGLIPLFIHELIDTKVAGLELPDDLPIVTGVTGNEVYPYCTDDVKVTVAGEVEKVSEQAINFNKLNAAPERVTAAVAVSNRAIDNSNFDLVGFVVYKIRKALAMTNALHVYSHCNFNHHLKSPFASVTPEEVTLDQNVGKNLAKKIAAMWDLGFEGEPELVMDKETETELLFTKRIPGQVGDRTVIENGRCLGYRYKVSPYINYTLNSADIPAKGADHYIGIGHWGYLAMEQHGEVRLTVDATSAAVAERNTTVIVFSTDESLTELSGKVNGADGTPQAFKLIKLVESDEQTTA